MFVWLLTEGKDLAMDMTDTLTHLPTWSVVAGHQGCEYDGVGCIKGQIRTRAKQ